MKRVRLRPAWSDAELARLYAQPHDHRQWPDHQARVDVTVAVGCRLAGTGVGSAADLSCGNGAILSALPANRRLFGDFAPGHELTGPIEQTVAGIEDVDLFVCCETIEHLDDPVSVLAAIRAKTKLLLLSTPVDAWSDENPEHYWAWDREAVEAMLAAAGFEPAEYAEVAPSYCFGVWACR